MNCLIQVNISLEDSKHGLLLEDVENFIKQEGICYYNELKKCSNIGYITGSIQYCVPPCYTCENYLNIK